VINSLAPFALRQMRGHLTSPPVVLTLLAVSVVLVLSGPFRTLDDLSLSLRAIYWTVVVFGTYATGTLVMQALGQRVRFRAAPLAARIAIGGMTVGVAVTVALALIDLIVLGMSPVSWRAVWQSGGIAVLVSVVIVMVGQLAAAPLAVPLTLRAKTLADRLPLAKRGPILHMTVEDHYVQVTTGVGRHMVLMPLADAIREMGDVPGLRVHRSHWVALSAVSAARRTGEMAVLTLKNGAEVPVSRRYVKAVQEAGFLPIRRVT
jgi:hypothetical protein